MKKRLLSLFSGCGGMDLGFEGHFQTHIDTINPALHPEWSHEKKGEWAMLPSTHFEVTFANDIFEAARNAWVPYFTKRGYSKHLFHLSSIVDLVKSHKNHAFEFPTNIDIVTGGFPCQDFSVAGKRKGFHSHKGHHGGLLQEHDNQSQENRGQLYRWMREVIEITKPKVFIAENVKGLVSLSNAKEMIEHDFSSIDSNGFLVIPHIIFAPDYGVPQRRERIIFIGLNKKHLSKQVLKALSKDPFADEVTPIPPMTHYNPSATMDLFTCSNQLKPYATVGRVLEDLKEPEDERFDLAQMKYSKAKYCPNSQGQIEVNLHSVSPTIRAEHHGNIEYRRLAQERGGKWVHELALGKKERRLTVRECARIQTFPDDYQFVRERSNATDMYLGASNAYKVIGNAVPPLLAYHLAVRLEHIWDKIFE